jgi:alkylation response protein AidB-like acyl-CoA dehydrogenase
MNFNFTEEQRLLADAADRFVRERYTFEARKGISKSADGWSREIWRELADLGITALNVPEAHGGIGGGPVETLLVVSAIGRGLLLEPVWPVAVLTPALLASLGCERTAGELLPSIATGESIVVVAHQEPASRGEVGFVATQARKDGDNYVLNGTKSVVLHAASANELLVSARTRGEPTSPTDVSVFRVDPKARGVTLKSYATLDGQRAADVVLENVTVPASARIGAEGQAFAAIEQAHDVGLAALCAEAVGIMQATLDATVAYTKERQQFGAPIAKFQVLQHRMVDMLMHIEQSRSMSYLAAIRCMDKDARERRRALSAAKVTIDQGARFVAQQAVQLHGGMGVTDELIVSHYFRRLTAIGLTLGDVDLHLERFAASSAA